MQFFIITLVNGLHIVHVLLLLYATEFWLLTDVEQKMYLQVNSAFLPYGVC